MIRIVNNMEITINRRQNVRKVKQWSLQDACALPLLPREFSRVLTVNSA